MVCTTIKPAEANGRGIVLRFVETQGKPTTASFQATFFGTPEKAIETSLLEEDRGPLTIAPGGKVTFTIEPFGVKTIRLVSRLQTLPLPGRACRGTAFRHGGRLEVDRPRRASGEHRLLPRLSRHEARFSAGAVEPRRIASPARRPSIGRCSTSAAGSTTASSRRPRITIACRAVDRWNNESPASAAVKATTLKSSEKNALPNRVERLSAILISPLGQHEHVNLLFRTNCESDVVRYEIHRCGTPGFVPGEKTRIGEVDADAIIKGSTAYGHTPIDRRLREFDHIMYQDNAVEAFSEYYYRVRAVDAAGQKGDRSPTRRPSRPTAASR